MKIKTSFYLLTALLLAFYSFSGNPPNGRTGAPGESTCAASGCHSTPNSTFAGSVVVTGLDNELVPGQLYNLTITVTDDNLNAVRAGFQLTNVGPDEDATVGTFSNSSINSTITPSGNRTYHEHNPAQVFSGGIATFTVDWTAPNTLADGDEVDFYMASVIANGSGSSNDLVVTNVVNTTMSVATSALEITLINSSDPLCTGESNGTATVEVTGGIAPYDIVWSSGETGTQAAMLPAGMNTVQVTDSDLASVTLDVDLTDPEIILDNLVLLENPACSGESSGTIIVQPSGGTGNLTLTWSTGESTSTISGLEAGDYTLEILDENDCTSIFTYNLVDPTMIFDNLIQIQNPTCAGEPNGSISISPSGGTGNLSLFWTNGESSNTISNLMGGTYSVQITDENNCVQSFTYILVDPTAVSATIIQESPLCFNSVGTLSVETNASNPTFLWSTGGAFDTIADVPAADYSVTVTDEIGCTAVGSYINPYSAEITVDLTLTGTEPPFTLEANPSNGVAPYTFLWNTNETSQIINGLDNGTYTVSVSDLLGCTQVDSFVIEDDCAFIVADSIFHILCSGDSTGAIYTEVTSVDGSAIQYSWNTGDSTSFIENISAGAYSLTYSTANCSETVEFIVQEPDPIMVTFMITHPTEEAPESGSITVSAEGGTAPLTFTWSPGGDGTTIDSLGAGGYILIITDANQCQKLDTIFLDTELCDLDFSVTTDTIFCEGDLATASVTINSSAGQNPMIEWSTGDTTEMINMLSAGSYWLKVTDSLACEDTINFVILPHQDALITLDTITTISCEDTLAYIDIEVVWNNGPFSYLWSNGDTTENADSLLEGEISVIVTNTKGCIATDTFLILTEMEENPSIEVSSGIIYLDSMGTFNGVPNLDILLTGSCADSLYAVTDSIMLDCSNLDDTIRLDVFFYNHDELIDTVQTYAWLLDTIAPYSTIGGDTVTLGTQFCGPGTVLLSFELDSTNYFDNCPLDLPIEITFIYELTESSIYCDTVLVSDASGNSTEIIHCIDVVIPILLEVEIDVQDVTCFGGNDGCIEVELSGGLNAQVYADTLCPLPSGNYSVFVDDETGCFFEEYTVFVGQPAELIITEVDMMNETPGESNGFIDVEITGGVAPYTFVWTENGVVVSNLEDLINYPSSQYILTVTDANGCVTVLNSFIDIVNAVFTPDLAKISVLENPFTDQLVVNNLPLDANIRILSATGSKMEQVINKESKLTIASQQWPSGVYFLTVEAQGNIRSFKVIKL